MYKKAMILMMLGCLGSVYGQGFMELLEKVDSTAEAAREAMGVNQQEPQSTRPDLATEQGETPTTFDPDRIGWQTVYLPYIRMQVPKTSRHRLNYGYGGYLDFNAFICHDPTGASVLFGVMSKEAFEQEVLARDLYRLCGDCKSEPLPPRIHPELAARNGRYIAYERRGDRMSLTAYAEVGTDSLFMLTVTAYGPSDFRQQVPEIFQYLLDQVEVLDEYGPCGRTPKVTIQSAVTPLLTERQGSTWGTFDQKAETFLAQQPDGDLILAAVQEDATYVQRYLKGDRKSPAGPTLRLGNLRLRDLVATHQGYAGLFIQKIPEGSLMYLIHYDEQGEEIFRTRLIEQAMITEIGSSKVWEGYDAHKLAQVDDKFVAYLSIEQRFDQPVEIQSPCSRNGVHQGDVMLTINARGRIEYEQPTSSSNSAGQQGSSMGVDTSPNSGRSGFATPNPSYGFWWGMSHSFTKDLVMQGDYALHMAVGDMGPNRGLVIRMRDVTAGPNEEPHTYCNFRSSLGKVSNARIPNGQNYVEGLMAGNVHADEEQIYFSYARATERKQHELFPQPTPGGLYDANYHPKDVFFGSRGINRNLTQTPELLETNVKSIPMGDRFLLCWNVFPENPQPGEAQDQMAVVDINGNVLGEVMDLPTAFFAGGDRNRPPFRLHRHHSVYHGSDLLPLDDQTALWARVLPDTGEVEWVTIHVPSQR